MKASIMWEDKGKPIGTCRDLLRIIELLSSGNAVQITDPTVAGYFLDQKVCVPAAINGMYKVADGKYRQLIYLGSNISTHIDTAISELVGNDDAALKKIRDDAFKDCIQERDKYE